MQYPQAGKHGLAAGPNARPERADWTIDQGWERYTAEEHAVWQRLYERQAKLLPGRACDEFLDGLRRLPIAADAIPDFRRLSDVLTKATGWQVVAVPGLVPDEVFFEHLANRRFPAGQFIRRPQQLDYLEEPDVFPDVFGHVPMLMHPVLADYIQAYGVGGLRAQRLGALPQLARVYWTRSSSAWCSSARAFASTARASPRRTPRACSRSTTRRRTASASIWSA